MATEVQRRPLLARPKRQFVAMAVVALILLALLGIAKYLGLIWPSQGPLGTTVGYGAGANVKASSTISLMYQLPDERLAAPIELEDIELLGPDRGLLRGDARVAICPDNGEGCSFAAVEAWPPTTADLHRLPGYVLSGGGNPHIAVEVSVRGLVGATLRSRGALLSYSQGGRRFRTELGPDVRLHVKPE